MHAHHTHSAHRNQRTNMLRVYTKCWDNSVAKNVSGKLASRRDLIFPDFNIEKLLGRLVFASLRAKRTPTRGLRMLVVFDYIKFNTLELFQNCQVRSGQCIIIYWNISRWSLWRNFLVWKIKFFAQWIFWFPILQTHLENYNRASILNHQNHNHLIFRRNYWEEINFASALNHLQLFAIPLEKVNIDLSISWTNCLRKQINCIKTDFEQYFFPIFALFNSKQKLSLRQVNEWVICRAPISEFFVNRSNRNRWRNLTKRNNKNLFNFN